MCIFYEQLKDINYLFSIKAYYSNYDGQYSFLLFRLPQDFYYIVINPQQQIFIIFLMPHIQSFGCILQVVKAIILALHSFIAAACYICFSLLIKDGTEARQIAEEIEQIITIFIPNHLNQQEQEAYIRGQVETQNQNAIERIELFGLNKSHQLKKISEEIKKQMLSHNLYLKIISKGNFILFQILELWGFFYFFTNTEGSDVGFYPLFYGYMAIVVAMGLYQYFSIYIFSFLVLVFLPVVLFYKIYECIKNYNERKQERIKIADTFKETIFFIDQDSEDDNDCAICMTQFRHKEKIVSLPCSDKHRYHTSCITSWLEVNNKCPLCRTEIIIN